MRTATTLADYFKSDDEDWSDVVKDLSCILSQCALDSPVKDEVERVPDLYAPGVFHRVSKPSAKQVKAWRCEAEKGKATSSSEPVILTPEPRASFFEVPTPEKIPQPTSKTLLVANKKLQQELKKNAAKSKQPSVPEPEEGKGADLGKAVPKCKVPAKETSDNKRKCGPMQPMMKEFINKHRKKGLTYVEARDLWLKSDEREQIVSWLAS